MTENNNLINQVTTEKNSLAVIEKEVNKNVFLAFISTLPFGKILTKSKAEKFSEGVAKTVTSQSFLQEASDKISQPRAGETEDEFVSRGLAVIKELLRAKLKM
ncbi:MAG: hypothetical protein ABF968_12880 [Acetobacter sp.]|uniref:hypothetical protein n=1 Tax=Acetobacter sp. TaxID=440 RepID=UPI0039E7BA6F